MNLDSEGFLKFCEFAERIEFPTYAFIVATTDRPIPLDPIGKKIGLPEPGIVASLVMLEIFPGRLRKFYSGKVCLREQGQKALNETKHCLLVREE